MNIIGFPNDATKKLFNKTEKDVEWVEVRPGCEIKRIYFDGYIFQKSHYFCQDCKGENDNYMLDKLLWVKLQLTGFICLSCVEKRLGRKLTKEDFLDVLINRLVVIGR